MVEGPYIAEAASLIGDPTRANILMALMDGRARTASELAYTSGVSPQTASGHLARLLDAQLIALERQGRHRYYRLANEHVAAALEALTVLAVHGPPRHRPTGPRDRAMRYARSCYDHLAGHAGVAITDALIAKGFLKNGEGDFALTGNGEKALSDFGLDLPALKRRKRPLVRSCLDWSERRPHLGGSVGAVLMDRLQHNGWLERVKDTRTMSITKTGVRELESWLGVRLESR